MTKGLAAIKATLVAEGIVHEQCRCAWWVVASEKGQVKRCCVDK
jgi:hypothetical protein